MGKPSITSTDTLFWSAPPAKQKRRAKPNKIESTFKKLEARPGEWARVQVRPHPGGLAYLSQGLRAKGATVTSRRLESGAYGLFAKVG